MGRHRRSAAGRATTDRATGTTDPHGGHAPAHGFGTPHAEDRTGRGHRRRRAAGPVRTGLLGVSAAVALGTVAVSSGVLPGLPSFLPGGAGDGPEQVRAASAPPVGESAQDRASADAVPGSRPSTPAASRSSRPPASPTPSASASASASAAPPAAPRATEPAIASADSPAARAGTPSRTTAAPIRSGQQDGSAASAEAQVLALVNQERAAAGCRPLTASKALASLAENFSRAMAEQGFFDHTDPSGATPWDRAARAGITDLGGENIARGQPDPESVMDSWMNSPGHRANILDCDFTTLGVGVHYGPGGPWWTQDFGY